MTSSEIPAADRRAVTSSEAADRIGAARLVAAFLSGRSDRTRRAYAGDLEDFRQFTDESDLRSAARRLLAEGHGEANALALDYRTHLVDRGLAPATVNRRLSALRSLVKLARTVGYVPWTLEIGNVRSRPYRDTRGPGPSEFLALLEAADGDGPKPARDRALLWLLFNPALRRGEVVALDVADVEVGGSGAPTAVQVVGKGRREPERVELPPRTARALAAWLDVRGAEPGPLFVSFDPTGKGDGRLTGAGVYAVVRDLGERAGLGEVRPHGLRHAGITALLDATGGNVRAGQAFSRHAKLETLTRYDDNRKDLGGWAARELDRHLARLEAEKDGGV